jgi:hypothetical protein
MTSPKNAQNADPGARSLSSNSAPAGLPAQRCLNRDSVVSLILSITRSTSSTKSLSVSGVLLPGYPRFPLVSPARTDNELFLSLHSRNLRPCRCRNIRKNGDHAPCLQEPAAVLPPAPALIRSFSVKRRPAIAGQALHRQRGASLNQQGLFLPRMRAADLA